MKTRLNLSVSRYALILLSLVVFANCAKKTNSSSKEKPKAEGTATTPPKPETADTASAPIPPPPASDNSSPAPSAPAPAPATPSATAGPAAAATPDTADSSTTDTAPTPSVISTQECLLKSVEEFTVLLKMEQSEITTENMKEIIAGSKANCNKTSELEPDLLKSVNQRLKEVVTREFPASADLVILFTEAETAEPKATVPASAAPATTQQPPAPQTAVETTEYRLQSFVQKGSRDFRQKDGAINYSISSVEGKGSVAKLTDETVGPVNTLSSSQKNYFSKVANYSFGLTLKTNKTYTLQYKDEAGELTLDYAFFEGSAEGLKKGESAKISLTKASWLKVIEHETQKFLNKYYPNTPRSAMKILLSPLDPPTSRTCSIGKGYFLGSHAIYCIDPEYRVRIQVLNQN